MDGPGYGSAERLLPVRSGQQIPKRFSLAASTLEPSFSTGFRSRIGVRSIASRSRTRIRVPCMTRICTRWRPIGFGRSADRVLNTPVSGLAGLSLGCTTSTSRRARSSHVSTRTSTGFEVAQSLAEPLVEDQPGVWSTFVSLFRRGFRIEQRRLDPADWRQLILSIAHLILHSAKRGRLSSAGTTA